MTTDEKLAVIARTLLELAKKAATTWEYDGETQVGTGVLLQLERELTEIAENRE